MTPDSSQAPSATKLLAAPRLRLRLALASSAILVAGTLIAPPATPTALSTPRELAAPMLEERAQTREPAPPFSGVQAVARQVQHHSVALSAAAPAPTLSATDFEPREARGVAGGVGVFVSETLILTHEAALDGRTALAVPGGDGRPREAVVTAHEAASGLVLLQTTPSGMTAAPLADSLPQPGDLVVGVARTATGPLVLPSFVSALGSARLFLAGAQGSVPPGTPLYNLDGELLALVAPSEAGVTAYAAGDAVKRLTALAASGRFQASFGMGLQDLSGPLAQIFAPRGALINDVVAGGPADQAGLRPGDVLAAIGTTELTSADGAVSALRAEAPGRATTLLVVRNGRELEIALTPLSSYEVATLARHRQTADDGPRARDLLPSVVLQAARLTPDDQVLGINGVSVSTRQQAERAMRGDGRPTWLLVRRAGRAFFTAMEPAP